MSLQSSTFNTAHVMENEIVKANDFEFAFEALVENVAKVSQMFLESTQDFVINGKVLPYQGMNVQISPIFGICKATGIPFGRTETDIMDFGFAESESGRVDIIEVQGEWETYDNQQRAFNDPDTDTQTYQYVDTKKLMKPVYRIKQGEEGSSSAPESDAGWVKLAEVVIRANTSTILESDIKNITSDVAGEDNTAWTVEKNITYNIGYISAVNARFRVGHNADGTHKDKVINSDSLDIGTGAKQINGNILPVGGSVTIPEESISSTDSILSVLVKTAAMLTSLYNAYLKYGAYNFNEDLSVSKIADANNTLIKPLTFSAIGDGTAVFKIDGNTVLSIDGAGKLHTNSYSVISTDNNNTVVTKAVTSAIASDLSDLTTRVANLETSADSSLYANGVLSTGTNGRYSMASDNIYAATTENVTLSGAQAIDGISLTDGVLILVKNQTDAKENGIYQYSSSSAWTRATSYSTPNLAKGKLYNVSNGTVNTGKIFYIPKVNFIDGSDFGTDDIGFLEYFGSIAKSGNKIAVRDSTGHVKTANAIANDDAVNKEDLNNVVAESSIVGEVKIWPGATLPSNRWMVCDGSELSRTEYAALFAVLGVTWGIGDGVTTFNIPDFRETALVGAGENTTDTIAIHDVYAVGAFKDDQLANHTHNIPLQTRTDYYQLNYLYQGTTSNPNTPTSVNRGKRKGVNFIIRVA